MNDDDYARLGHNTEGRRKRWKELAPDGTLGRKKMGPSGMPPDKEKWGDEEYGSTVRGTMRCHAIKKNGKRCQKWSIEGSHLCRSHGGNFQIKVNDSKRFYGRAAFAASRQTLSKAFEGALADPDLTSGMEEAALARAILGTSLAKLTAANLEGFDPDTAEKLLAMVKDTQAICMGPKHLELKTKNSVSLAEFYLIANGLMDLVYTEIRRLAKSEQVAENSVRRIAHGLLTLELKGERVFEDDGRSEDSLFKGVVERAGFSTGEQADDALPPEDEDDDDGIGPGENEISNETTEDDDRDVEPGNQKRPRQREPKSYYPSPDAYDPNKQPDADEE